MIRLALALLVATLAAGCASAPPQAIKPAVSIPEYFSRQPTAFNVSADGAWWMSFQDEGLEKAVIRVLSQNLDLEQAVLRVQQSRALADRVRTQSLPRLDLGASATASRASTQTPQAATPGFDRTTQSLGVNARASWELDLFGKNLAALSAQQARVKVTEAELRGLALSLSAETGRRVLELRGVQEQIRLADEAIAVERELLEVVEARFRGGQVTQADVMRVKAQLETTRVNRQRLNVTQSDANLALAVLMASTPDEIQGIVGTGPLPVGPGLEAFATAPAAVLARRPDVEAAQQRLAAASSDLAVAAADKFPKVNLLASVGLAAARLSSLGGADALLATIAPSATWRVFDFGELDAIVAERRASEQIATAAYRQTVLNAFSEAESALTRISARQDELDVSQRAADVQRQAWELAKLQYEKGVGDLTVALEARRLLNSLKRDVTATRLALAAAEVEAYRVTALNTNSREGQLVGSMR